MIHFGDSHIYYRPHDEYIRDLCSNINSHTFHIGHNFKSTFPAIVYSHFGYGVMNLLKSNVHSNQVSKLVNMKFSSSTVQ